MKKVVDDRKLKIAAALIIGIISIFMSVNYININAGERNEMKIKTVKSVEVAGVEIENIFNTDDAAYFAGTAAYETASVKVKVLTYDAETVKINGETAASGEESSNIDLEVGNNTIEIQSRNERIYITLKRLQNPDILYKEAYRPQFHNTPQMFLMNDPNGLVYNEETEEYHLYYQYAAALMPNQETKVWAHAVSDDLVHWKEMPIAINVDEWGEIYSGSAVIDRNNTSGLFDENTPAGARMVAMFTSYSGKFGDSSHGDQVQSLAYSKDNGTTWIKYEGNPVIKNDRFIYGGDFRDPKVVWYEDLSYTNGGIWLAVIASGGGAKLFASENLIEWTYQSSLRYKESNGNVVECPDLFPMPVNGDANNIKWVFAGSIYNNGDSRVVYAVGDLNKNEKGAFDFEADHVYMDKSINGNNAAYAQQTFFNDASGRRIAISWIRDWVGFNEDNNINIKNWLGTHTLAAELTLEYKDGVYSIKQNPVEELKKLRKEDMLFNIKDKTVNDKTENILSSVKGRLFEIEAEFTLGTAAEFGFNLRTGDNQKTVVYYDVQSRQFILDRTNSGIAMSEGGEVIKIDAAPSADNKVKVRIYSDTSIIDIYANDGESVINTQIYPSVGNENMEFFARGGDVTVNSLSVYELDSIHFKKITEGSDLKNDNADNKKKIPVSSVILMILGGVLLIAVGVMIMGYSKMGRKNTSNTEENNENSENKGTESNINHIIHLPEEMKGKGFWKGKKLAFLGDSITELDGYQRRVAGKLGASDLYVHAVSGTQISGTSSSFTQRCEEIPSDADLIFVFGGTNDFHVGVPLGLPSDESCTETFCGAVKLLCEKLETSHPDALIVFATPLQRTCFPGTGEELNSQGVKCSAYRDAIVNVCSGFNIPVLDFYYTSKITEETSKEYLFDGLHPNADGFRVISDEIIKYFCPEIEL